jgi:hypothetical protein
LSERVVAVGVVTGREEEDPRAVLAGDRRDDVLGQRQELVRVGTRTDREVDREAVPLTAARVVGCAGPGIQRALVDARVEHRWVLVEDRLGPVAVVDVPVEDQRALDPVGRARVRRGDGDVVEEAEAHCSVGLGVVAGRPQPAEGEARRTLVAEQPVDGVDGAPSRVQRRLPGARARDGVVVDVAAAALDERLDRLDVCGVMDPQKLLDLRRRGLDHLEPHPVALRHRLLDGDEAALVLGVRTGLVLEGTAVADV